MRYAFACWQGSHHNPQNVNTCARTPNCAHMAHGGRCKECPDANPEVARFSLLPPSIPPCCSSFTIRGFLALRQQQQQQQSFRIGCCVSLRVAHVVRFLLLCACGGMCHCEYAASAMQDAVVLLTRIASVPVRQPKLLFREGNSLRGGARSMPLVLLCSCRRGKSCCREFWVMRRARAIIWVWSVLLGARSLQQQQQRGSRYRRGMARDP